MKLFKMTGMFTVYMVLILSWVYGSGNLSAQRIKENFWGEKCFKIELCNCRNSKYWYVYLYLMNFTANKSTIKKDFLFYSKKKKNNQRKNPSTEISKEGQGKEFTKK